ncbi:uncharacterized protein LOC111696239 [Eurytemora carolleeae]|uniref:uncharacterized protein LOC111696239 n=1 Tax=Eurytemora carolleeae TaxID=1294199 RepID=UPI000C769E53|nr:uncharacterized protein LOC111696239 [Eurytemora carolleeae]|eukprot:XP_023321560.1 uncharacterized protein LOC111696239 [Eurytemora affinis]
MKMKALNIIFILLPSTTMQEQNCLSMLSATLDAIKLTYSQSTASFNASFDLKGSLAACSSTSLRLELWRPEDYEALGNIFWNEKMPLKNQKMHSDDLTLPLDQKHPSTYQNPTSVDQKFFSFDEKLSTSCSDLDERVLILHYQSQPILENSSSTVMFPHIYQRMYVLRLCSCGRLRRCVCSISGAKTAICKIISLPFPTSSEPSYFFSSTFYTNVNPSCRGTNDRSLSSLIESRGEVPVVHNPTWHLTANELSISGTIPSCSTVQIYDEVQITLYEVSHRDETCDVGSKIKRFENLNPSFVTTSRNGIQSVISHLKPNNNTSGMFYARFLNIKTVDVAYCIFIKLVNHPYCNVGRVSRQSYICKPISLIRPIHLGLDEKLEKIETDYWMVFVIFTVLFFIFILILVLIVVTKVRSWANLLRKEFKPAEAEKVELINSVFTIALLYISENQEEQQTMEDLRNHLSGIGHKVLDLYSEIIQEEACYNPESWLLETIHSPETKIVVLENYALARGLLKAETAPGAGGIGPLTVFAVEQVLAGYSDNYRKVGVVKMGELKNSTATGLVLHTQFLFQN